MYSNNNLKLRFFLFIQPQPEKQACSQEKGFYTALPLLISQILNPNAHHFLLHLLLQLILLLQRETHSDGQVSTQQEHTNNLMYFLSPPFFFQWWKRGFALCYLTHLAEQERDRYVSLLSHHVNRTVAWNKTV